ncbi:MAG TPA: YggT family protein [Armatimonadota bacterium]|jgi:uncharacterized protein YggT (Ycf19 family)
MHPVAFVLGWALGALQLILFVYIILSWLRFWQQSSRSAPRFDLDNPVVRWIESVAYTILHPIRGVIDPYQRNTGIDFSAIIAFLILGLVQGWVQRLPF